MSQFDKKNPEHLFQNLGSESRTCRQFDFPSKRNMVVDFFSESDKTLKVAKNHDLGFAG